MRTASDAGQPLSRAAGRGLAQRPSRPTRYAAGVALSAPYANGSHIVLLVVGIQKESVRCSEASKKE